MKNYWSLQLILDVSLHEEFQRGDIGSPGSLHRLIRGLVNQRALKRDEFITPELTNHLFQTPGIFITCHLIFGYFKHYTVTLS